MNSTIAAGRIRIEIESCMRLSLVVREFVDLEEGTSRQGAREEVAKEGKSEVR